MGKLQTFLLEGNGVIVSNETQFDDLVNECSKIGFFWRHLPMHFNNNWRVMCISLLDGFLVYHNPDTNVEKMLLMKWDVMKFAFPDLAFCY